MKINDVYAELEWDMVGRSIVRKSNLDAINVQLWPVKFKVAENTVAE